MWKRVLISFILVVLLLLVGMYGASYSIGKLREKYGGKTHTQKTIYEAVETMMPTIATTTSWSIVSIILAVSAILAYRLPLRGRLLETVKPKDFTKHLLLFGPTGSGKTSTAMKAVELALRGGAETVIVDWKGEYSGFFIGATIIRKLELLKPDVDHETYSLVLTDILRDVLELTEPMAYMLYDELVRGYRVHGDRLTFSKLVKSLEARRLSALQARSYAEANIAEGLIRRLYLLALDEKRPAANIIGSGRVIVYDLSPLPTYQLRCFYAQIILWRLYNNARSSRRPARKPRLEKLLVLEESQNYVRPRRPERLPSIGERIVNELRGYGCGAVVMCPDPTQIPFHMARDAGAVISIGYQGLPEVVAELLSFYRYSDIKKLIKTTNKMRTYIYYNGRLHIRGVPRPYSRIIDLGVQTREEPATAVEEVKAGEAGKPVVRAVGELKLEEEGEMALKEAEPAEMIEKVAEEVEGPGGPRVDPSGGIPIQGY